MRANYHPVGRTRQAPLLVCDEAKGARTVHLAAHALHRVAHRLARRLARVEHELGGRPGALAGLPAAHRCELQQATAVLAALAEELDQRRGPVAGAWQAARARLRVDVERLEDVVHPQHMHAKGGGHGLHVARLHRERDGARLARQCLVEVLVLDARPTDVPALLGGGAGRRDLGELLVR